MKFLGSLAGLVFLLAVGIVFAYYFAYFIPYTAESAKYQNDLLTYRHNLEKCESAHSIKITTGTDSGQVAGCSDINRPVEPKLPFANVIRMIGEYTHLDFLEHVGDDY